MKPGAKRPGSEFPLPYPLPSSQIAVKIAVAIEGTKRHELHIVAILSSFSHINISLLQPGSCRRELVIRTHSKRVLSPVQSLVLIAICLACCNTAPRCTCHQAGLTELRHHNTLAAPFFCSLLSSGFCLQFTLKTVITARSGDTLAAPLHRILTINNFITRSYFADGFAATAAAIDPAGTASLMTRAPIVSSFAILAASDTIVCTSVFSGRVLTSDPIFTEFCNTFFRHMVVFLAHLNGEQAPLYFGSLSD